MAKQVWEMTAEEIQGLVSCKYCKAAKGSPCVPVRREKNLRGPHVTRGWDARDLLRVEASNPVVRGSDLSAAGAKASELVHDEGGKPVAVGGSNPSPRALPNCPECDNPLRLNDPNDPSGFPYHCPHCDYVFDHEHVSEFV